MAIWDQTVVKSSGNLIVQGTTSSREILGFHGDNLLIPSVRGRSNADIAGTTSEITSCFSVLNPTTVTLWVDGINLLVTTASSSSAYISLGIGAIDTTGGELVASVSCSTTLWAAAAPFYFTAHSSNVFPIAWATGTYFTGTAATTTGISTAALRAQASVFYVTQVVT